MPYKDEFRRELLQQDHIKDGAASDETRATVAQMLRTEARRVRRLKWAVGIAWGLFTLYMIAGGVASALRSGKPDRPFFETSAFGPIAALLAFSLPCVAIVLTAALILRVRGRNNLEIRRSLSDIEARLARLEKDG